MLDLKHGECKSWNMKVAKQRLFIKGLKQVRNIVYAGTGASKKDHLRIAWAGKQIQYSPHFFRNDSSKQKKFSSFAKGAARWMFYIYLCRNHLIWASASRILWKTQPWDIFAKVRTAKCIASYNYDGSLEDDYYVPFFKLKFLIPTWRHIFCSSKPSKTYGESDFESSVLRNKLYIFLWFQKKETLISNGRKI